jgi:TRAP transporter TAXI family solute receptor
MKMPLKVVSAVAGAVIMAGAAPIQAETYNLTLTGASPGGLWSRIGGGIDAAIAKAYPGSTVTYQTSSGGLANIPLVAGGKVPIGFATDGDLSFAKAGMKPFRNKIENVRILFRAYTSQARFQMTHLMLSKDFADKHSVNSFADIVNKKLPVRVAINRRGNSDSDVSRVIMELMGASAEDIESWGGQVVYAASKEIVSLMLDRRIDLANFGIAYNHPRIREIAKGVTPVLLDIPADVAAKTAEQFGGEVCKVKAGEYAWSDTGMTSVCVGMVVVAGSDMSEQLAYDITKAMVEQIDEFKEKSHRLIKKTASPQSLSTGSIYPHHPGAAKFYREAGLSN